MNLSDELILSIVACSIVFVVSGYLTYTLLNGLRFFIVFLFKKLKKKKVPPQTPLFVDEAHLEFSEKLKGEPDG